MAKKIEDFAQIGAILFFAGIAGLWIFNNFFGGTVQISLVVFFAMLAILLFITIKILGAAGEKQLTLENALILLGVGAAIIYVFTVYPQLIPSNFEFAMQQVKSVLP